MTRPFMLMIVIVAVHRPASGQEQPIKFEVASVRPSTPPVPEAISGGGRRYAASCQGGPGTRDPTRLSCPHINIARLIFQAFDLKPYQCKFPSWMSSAWFALTANIPVGATKEQLRLMEQDLLAERFKLSAHFEKKKMLVYELTIAKSGPKLKQTGKHHEVPEDSPSSSNAAQPAKLERDADGFPLPPPWFGPMSATFKGGRMRIRAIDRTLPEFASFLSSRFAIPVQDATRLRGNYDIMLTCSAAFFGSVATQVGESAMSAASTPGGIPTCPEALRQQLGLQLTREKGLVDFFVLDHIEKVPTEN